MDGKALKLQEKSVVRFRKSSFGISGLQDYSRSWPIA
jgi:hypothetical protein